MRKVDGVQRVEVSLKNGLTILDLRPGNRVTVAGLRTIIKNNGFVSKNADIVARGTPHADAFEVSATGERLTVLSPPTAVDGGQWRLTAIVR